MILRHPSATLRTGAHHRYSGFTFIELLVVITIIGVIFAAGIVSFVAITTRSRDVRRKADLEAIRQSLEICRSLKGVYPTTIYESNGTMSCEGVTGPVLMTKTPTDPRPCTTQPDGTYTYTVVGGTTYTLVAKCMEIDTSYEVKNP